MDVWSAETFGQSFFHPARPTGVLIIFIIFNFIQALLLLSTVYVIRKKQNAVVNMKVR